MKRIITPLLVPFLLIACSDRPTPIESQNSSLGVSHANPFKTPNVKVSEDKAQLSSSLQVFSTDLHINNVESSQDHIALAE